MADRFADLVEGLRQVLDRAVDWRGRELALGGVETMPLLPGVTAPHLLLAAHGRRGLDLVARYGDGWSTYGGPGVADLAPDEFWTLVGEQAAALTAACERRNRDPATPRRSLLLGFGTLRPAASVDSFLDAVGRASTAGFDEVVVYWPDGEPGDRFWSDPEVHAEALTRLGKT